MNNMKLKIALFTSNDLYKFITTANWQSVYNLRVVYNWSIEERWKDPFPFCHNLNYTSLQIREDEETEKKTTHHDCCDFVWLLAELSIHASMPTLCWNCASMMKVHRDNIMLCKCGWNLELRDWVVVLKLHGLNMSMFMTVLNSLSDLRQSWSLQCACCTNDSVQICTFNMTKTVQPYLDNIFKVSSLVQLL